MRSRESRRRPAMSTPRSSRKSVTARSRPRFSPRRSSTSPRTTTSSTWRRIQPATAESAAAELSTPWRTTGCADDQLLEYRQSVEHVALQSPQLGILAREVGCVCHLVDDARPDWNRRRRGRGGGYGGGDPVRAFQRVHPAVERPTAVDHRLPGLLPIVREIGRRLHPSQQVDVNLAVLAFADTETGHVPEHPLAVGEERELEG